MTCNSPVLQLDCLCQMLQKFSIKLILKKTHQCGVIVINVQTKTLKSCTDSQTGVNNSPWQDCQNLDFNKKNSHPGCKTDWWTSAKTSDKITEKGEQHKNHIYNWLLLLPTSASSRSDALPNSLWSLAGTKRENKKQSCYYFDMIQSWTIKYRSNRWKTLCLAYINPAIWS